jgi:hypothetical protein
MTTEASKKVKVLVASTDGPIEVVNLFEEHRNALTWMNYPGRDDDANDDYYQKKYAQFVSTTYGLVQRLYGGEPFGLELSRRIDAGDSWHLGILIAHALYAEERLAITGSREASTVLLVTGQFGPRRPPVQEINVIGVDGVKAKLETASKRLQAEKQAGRDLIVAWPKANHADAEQGLDALVDLAAETIECETVNDLLAKLGLKIPDYSRLGGTYFWRDAPYQGLEFFDEHHSAIFFGRRKVRDEACGRLQERESKEKPPFLLVYGRSGAGKSSLVRAGLIEDILKRTNARAKRWHRAIFTPTQAGAAPVAAMAKALSLADVGVSSSVQELTDAILRRPTEVTSQIKIKLMEESSKLVLVVDQLEELFFWVDAENGEQTGRQRNAFGVMLEKLAGEGVWIIATIRTDLLPLLEHGKELLALATDENRLELRQPDETELREIIESPAKLAGLSVEDRLTDALATQAAAAPDSLPLLEYALDQIYLSDAHARRLTYKTYHDEIGGLTGIIGRKAETTVLELLTAEAEGNQPRIGVHAGDKHAIDALVEQSRTQGGIIIAIEDVILALGRSNPESDDVTGSDSHAVVARTLLLDVNFLTPAREGVIKKLVQARLLARGADPASRSSEQTPYVRVAHEALLRDWPRAQALFAEHGASIALRDRLKEDAEEWKANKQDPAYLIPSGGPLEAAKALRDQARLDLGEARGFIEASIKRADTTAARDRRSRNRALAAVVVMVFITGSAIWSRVELAHTNSEVERTVGQLKIANEKNRELAAKDRKALQDIRTAQRLSLLAQAKNAAGTGDMATAALFALEAVNHAGCSGETETAAACAGPVNLSSKDIKEPLTLLRDYLDQLRERTVLRTEEGIVATSSDGSLVLRRPKTIYMKVSLELDLLDVESRKLLENFADEGYGYAIVAYAFSPKPGDNRLFLAETRGLQANAIRLEIWPGSGDTKSAFLPVASYDELGGWRQECSTPNFFLPGIPLKSHEPTFRFDRMSVSPDGNYIAVAVSRIDCDKHATGGHVFIIDTRDGNRLATLEGRTRSLSFDFTTGHQRVLIVSDDGRARLQDIQPTGTSAQGANASAIFLPNTTTADDAVFSPDGHYAMVVRTYAMKPSSIVWDVRTENAQPEVVYGSPEHPLRLVVRSDDGPPPVEPPRVSAHPAFSTDSRRLLLPEGEVLELGWRQPLRSFRDAKDVAMNPDGKSIAYIDVKSIAHLRTGLETSSPPDVVLNAGGAEARDIWFSKDGHVIFISFADGTTRTWRTDDERTPSNASKTSSSTPDASEQLEQLISDAKRLLPHCLPPKTLQEAFLTAPPRWCAEMHKWPYDKS